MVDRNMCIMTRVRTEHEANEPLTTPTISNQSLRNPTNNFDSLANLVNVDGMVKELLGDHTGIIEDLSRGWMCLFTASRAVLRPGVIMKQRLTPGTMVQINANLMEKTNKIQYLATLVYSSQDCIEPILLTQKASEPVESSLVQKYFDVNEMFADEDSAGNAPRLSYNLNQGLSNVKYPSLTSDPPPAFGSQPGLTSQPANIQLPNYTRFPHPGLAPPYNQVSSVPTNQSSLKKSSSVRSNLQNQSQRQQNPLSKIDTTTPNLFSREASTRDRRLFTCPTAADQNYPAQTTSSLTLDRNFTSHPPQSTSPQSAQSFPVILTSQVGTVYRILDDNFGLARCGNMLCLFDTCDFYITPDSTADREQKRLQDLVRVNDKIKFHATLMDKFVKIQYLANAVWLESRPWVNEAVPKPLNKDKIKVNKIEIYQTVLNTVAQSLPDLQVEPEPNAKTIRPVENPTSLELDVSVQTCLLGKVSLVFLDRQLQVMGGLIESVEDPVNKKGNSFETTFFHWSTCQPDLPMDPGFFVKLNLKTLGGALSPSVNVPNIALSVYSVKSSVAERPSNVERKVSTAIKILFTTVENLGIDFFTSSRLKNPSLTRIVVTNPNEVVVGEAKLACMVTKRLGVLQDIHNKGVYIFFEVSDLNFDQPLKLIDLMTLLDPMPGIKVKYYATRMCTGPIQLAAMTSGVQVEGEVAKICQYAKHNPVIDPNLRKSTREKQERLKNFQTVQFKFFSNETLSWDEVKKEEEAAKCVPKTDSNQVVNGKGIVKLILNENFALLFGPSSSENKAYSLFDTYDLMIGENMSAADRNLSVKKVLEVGSVVNYNACLVDKGKCVPFLATAVWKSGTVPNISAMPAKNIQKEKLDVYHQVVKTCEPLIMEKKQSDLAAARKDVASRLAAVQRSGLIDDASSDHNHLRSHREPTGTFISGNKTQENASMPFHSKASVTTNPMMLATKNPAPEDKSEDILLDGIKEPKILDMRTTGVLYIKMHKDFALFKLMDGKICLVHFPRAWIRDRPIQKDWSTFEAIHPSYKTHICARKIEGVRGIDYQTIFQHTALETRDPETGKFLYSRDMRKWIKEKANSELMDFELEYYLKQQRSVAHLQ